MNFLIKQPKFRCDLEKIAQKIDEITTENDQKQLLDQIITTYLNCINSGGDELKDIVGTRYLLLDLFARYSNKKGLKKFIQIQIVKYTLADEIVKTSIEEIIDSMKIDQVCYINHCSNLMNFIYILQCGDFNLIDKYKKDLLPLFVLVLEGFVTDFRTENQNNLEKLLNTISKQILYIFSKSTNLSEISTNYSKQLLQISLKILENPQVGFDLKTKSGLILIYSLNILPEINKIGFVNNQLPCLDLIEHCNKCNWFLFDGRDVPNLLLENDSIKVVIYSAIFNVLSEEYLLNSWVFNKKKSLMIFLYEELLFCAKRTMAKQILFRVTGNPPQIIEVSRTLSMLSKNLKFIPQQYFEELYQEALSFIWSHVEHFVDTVRNYAKIFFVDVTSVAAIHYKNGNERLIKSLIQNLKETSKLHAVWFQALENLANFLTCEFLLDHFEKLSENLLKLTWDASVGELACKTYINLMEKHLKEIDEERWIAYWIKPVVNIIKHSKSQLTLQQRIIYSAFRLSPSLLRILYPLDYFGNIQECNIILKCLQIARKNNLTVCEISSCDDYWHGLLYKKYLDSFKIHQDEQIRISVLATIVETQKSTEIFTPYELEFLLTYLKYNITSQSPSIRKQIVSFFKKALTRFQASLNVLLRKKMENSDLIEIYQQFSWKITKMLLANLARDANFFRRSMSLDLLLHINGILRVDEWLKYWEEDDVQNCLNILFDSYESNKKLAVEVLRTLPAEVIGFSSVEFTQNYLENCIEMSMDIRPSITLSATYMFQVCSFSKCFLGDNLNSSVDQRTLHLLAILSTKLQEQCDSDLDIVKTKTSHYGIIQSIRHLLENRNLTKNPENYSKLFQNLIEICLRIRMKIMPIVCNPSPEGYLPDDEIETDDTAKAQMILVYAWRTMKEMTLLLAEIVRQTIQLESTMVLLKSEILIEIGEFFIEVFLESKHRGVFEQAFVGFSVICKAFWISSNQRINALPRIWLVDSLKLCTGEIQSKKLCATRRSAGLPFLILSILTTEPTVDKCNFHEAMKSLMAVCENSDSSIEYRTHCLNVLRALFRDSKLGEQVSPYVAQAVIIAITGFKNKNWGVRNSSTLLYAALITRIFGVQRTQDSEDVTLKNRLTVRVFFMRYPALFDFLLETLSKECYKSDSLILHPVLMILARLYPSHIQEYNKQMDKYLPLVTICLSNPVYRTRELAARASIPLIPNEMLNEYFDKVSVKIESCLTKENEVHGLLLQVWHLLKSNNCIVDCSKFLINSLNLLNRNNISSSLYMEIILLFLKRFPKWNDLNILKEIVHRLSIQPNKNVTIMSQNKFYQTRFNLLLFIILNKFEESNITYTTISNEFLKNLNNDNDFEMYRYCLYFLYHLNYVSHNFNSHPLVYLKEIEIPEYITNLINSFKTESNNKLLRNFHLGVSSFLEKKLNYSNLHKTDETILLFLILNYYPCVMKRLSSDKTSTGIFQKLVRFAQVSEVDEVVSAVLTCVGTFLQELSVDDLQQLEYDDLIKLLASNASPNSPDFCRLVVCDILTKNRNVFYSENSILKQNQKCDILNIIMVLLEDDDIFVRNSISKLKSNNSKTLEIPEKIKEDVLNNTFRILGKEQTISFIFSWACRSFPDNSNEASEIFERGELNLFTENISHTDLCVNILIDLLWPSSGINLIQGVETLLKSLKEFPMEMMEVKTRNIVIDGLKQMEQYLLLNYSNFDFCNYFNKTFLEFLKNNIVTSDLYTVRNVVKQIFYRFYVD